MSTINTIILDTMEAMQTLNATISGMYAPAVAKYPTVIDTAGLPFCLTWPGEGEAWQKGPGYDQDVMTYRVIVYLDPVAQNDLPVHAVDGATLLQTVWNLYVKSANTPLIPGPSPAQVTLQSGPDGPHMRHGGLVPTLSFGGRGFFGFELQIPVRVQWLNP